MNILILKNFDIETKICNNSNLKQNICILNKKFHMEDLRTIKDY